MVHHISGLIGKEETFHALLTSSIGQEPRKPLTGGWAFVPLDDKNLDALTQCDEESAIEGFEFLTIRPLNAVCIWSVAGDIAYVETDYFGGTGAQGSVVARAGQVILGPSVAPTGPINTALATLGIPVLSTDLDGFDILGLGLHRSNESFRLTSR